MQAGYKQYACTHGHLGYSFVVVVVAWVVGGGGQGTNMLHTLIIGWGVDIS